MSELHGTAKFKEIKEKIPVSQCWFLNYLAVIANDSELENVQTYLERQPFPQ